MEIRVLRYFLTAAREGNITNAANFLHVTQPTISRQLKDLEEELGKKLFVRKKHSISLTAEGMLLRKRAEEILAIVDKTQEEFQALDEVISGEVYIGGGETEGMKQIADIIAALREEYPQIHYHLYSGNADDVTERLDRGLLDFGLLIQPADVSKYDALDLPTVDQWGVVMRKDSPMVKKDRIRKEDLLHVPLICSRQAIRQTYTKSEFIDWFGEDFAKLNIVTTFNLVFNAAIMVEKGIGYALTIDKLVQTTEDSALCFRPFDPPLASGLLIVWKKNQVFSPAAALFLSRLQEVFQKDKREASESKE